MATGSTNTSTNTKTEEDITNLKDTLSNHTSNTNNPHSVTKADVGLGNCDNTSDLDKPISTAVKNKYGNYITSIGFTSYDVKRTLFLLSDVTDWYNGTPWKNCIRIYGNIMGFRSGITPYNEQAFTNIVMSLHYRKGDGITYQLSTSNKNIRPCIVSTTNDNGDTIYWLAINIIYSQNTDFIFTGVCYDAYNNAISFSNKIGYSTSLDLPDGYTLVMDCEPFTQSNFALGTRWGGYYDYAKIKALEDRIAALENK